MFLTVFAPNAHIFGLSAIKGMDIKWGFVNSFTKATDLIYPAPEYNRELGWTSFVLEYVPEFSSAVSFIST